MLSLKKPVCIKRDAFDSKLDVFVKSFDHGYCDDYDVCGDSGCASVVAVNVDLFFVHLHRFQMLNGN